MKRKLLLAACFVAGAVGMKAQTDVTATYLTNADFSSGTPIDNNVCTYGKDMEGNSTTYYGAQAIEGWTNASVGETDNGYENSKLAGALFAYGSTPWLAGSGTIAPTTDPNGNAGNAAGLCAVWGGSIQYTQAVTLPAGSYTVRFKVYNATTNNGSGKFITTNLFGFAANGGTTYYAPNKTFAIGQWSTVAVTFNLAEETAGTISMGFVGPSGNADMPHLFVDNVKILKNEFYTDKSSAVNATGWTRPYNNDGEQGTAFTRTDGTSVRMQATYGNSSANRQIYQTISGLDDGSYEVVVYAYSQQEWGNGGAALTHDSGEAGYVFAEGTTTIKEWINARRGPGYPADGPGIYTISDVKVTNGTMTIGYALDKANQTEWHAIQVQSLIYTNGPDLSDYIEVYETALENAKAIESAKMESSILSALQSALSTYASVDKTSIDAMTTAAEALTTATTNANASIANYAEAKTILDAANNYDSYGQASYAANETISAIQSAYDDGSLTSVSAEQKTAANAALVTACKAQIQPANDCDMTAFIVNPGIDGNVEGWTCNMNGNGGYVGGPLKPSNDAMEFWGAGTLTEQDNGKSFDYYQTITGLPEGAYTISAEMLNSTNGETGASWNGGGKAGLYGKTASAEVTKLITTDGETFLPYTTDEILVIDGNLRLGVKNVAALTGRWFAADNFKLTYVRQLTAEEKEVIAKKNAVALYNEALAAAQAIADGTIPADAYTALQDVITANTLENGTSTEYNAAATALSNATTNAAAMVAPYAAWKELKSQADALVEVSNNDADANSTLDDAITVQNTAAEDATTASDLTTAVTTLKSAMTTYATTVQPTNDECFDITFMIENPHFTEGNGGTAIPTGWTLESGSITEHRLSTHNFEAYHKEFNLSQTISELPKGTYKVTLQGFARHDNASVTNKTNLYCGIVNQPIKDIKAEYSTTSIVSGKPNVGDSNGELTYTLDGNTVYQPNGMSASYYWFQETNPSTSQPFYTNEVQTLITEPGDLKIGFKCETNTDWVIWDNFHLYYYGSAIAVTIDENESVSSYAEDIENANVTLNRTIKAEGTWNTIFLPFDLTDAETKAAFGSDVKIATFSEEADGENSTVIFNTADDAAIIANTPVLLKTSTAGTTYSFSGKTIKAGTASVAGTNFDFVGTYAASTKIAEGDYFISANKLYKSAGSTTIKGTRAYLKAKTAGAKVRMIIDDEATGIEGIAADAVQNGKVYDLSGRLVKNPTKGLYIQNGKKYFVK